MTIRDTYKYYKSKSKNPVSISVYTKIINAYICFIMGYVFEGIEVSLPSRFGSIKIVGRKQKVSFDEEGNIKGLSPNWRRTKELWDSDPQAKLDKKLVYNTNENTNGVIYRFHWSKGLCTLKFKSIYSIVMTRANKRELFRLITQEQKEYHSL